MRLYNFVLFLLGISFQGISQEGILDSIDAGWERIENYEEQDEVLMLVSELVALEDLLYNSEIEGKVRSQHMWRIYRYDLDIEELEEILVTKRTLLSKAYEFDGMRVIFTNPKIAESQFKKSIESRDDFAGSFRVYRWLAMANSLQEKLKKSITFYDKCIEAALEYFVDSPVKGARFLSATHTSAVPVHINRGDFRSAKKHANQALKYARHLNDDYYINNALQAKIQAIRNSESPETIVQLILEQQQFLHFLDENAKSNFYNTLGNAYFDGGDYQKALVAFQTSNSFDDFQINRDLSSQTIGQCYHELGEYDKAIEIFTQLIHTFSQTEGNKSSLSEAYFVRAFSHKKKGDLFASRQDILEAINLKGEKENWHLNHFPLLASIYMDFYEDTNDLKYLDSVKLTMLSTDSLIHSLKFNQRYFESQEELGGRLYTAYASNILVLSRLYEKNPDLVNENTLFSYFENLKAYSLKEQLKTDDAVVIGSIPETVLDQEREFKLDRLNIQRKIYQLESNSVEAEEIEKLTLLLDEQTDLYHSFLRELETDYPGYYRHQYSDQKIDLTDLQHKLILDEILLEYYISAKYIFLMAITADSYKLYRKKLPVDWLVKVESLKEVMTNPQSSLDDFQSRAHYFYSLLIEEAVADMSTSTSRIRIVPDNVLNFIPFEILVSNIQKDVEFRNLSYLQNNYSISYLHSAEYLVNSSHKKDSKRKLDYIGFAPYYDSPLSDTLQSIAYEATRGNFVDLPFARKSVEEASELFGGQVFTDKFATLASFNQNAQNANIIHLAMHGIIDLDQPAFSKLVFYEEETDHSLFAGDVYGLDLHSDLAVLSACNTGIGKLINGDGIQNMSRAFSFAGVKNTIMSLWSVPDVQTAELNKLFFKEVKEGQSIDIALRTAKQNYLREVSQLRTHPYYWAGLVANGTMTPVQLNSSFLKSPLFISILLLVSLFIAFYFNIIAKKN